MPKSGEHADGEPRPPGPRRLDLAKSHFPRKTDDVNGFLPWGCAQRGFGQGRAANLAKSPLAR
jgi:hypothetical protein